MQVMTTECLGRSTARQRRAPYAPPARRARLDTIETWEHITTSTDIDIANCAGRLLSLDEADFCCRLSQAGALVWPDLPWASEAAISEDASGVRR